MVQVNTCRTTMYQCTPFSFLFSLCGNRSVKLIISKEMGVPVIFLVQQNFNIAATHLSICREMLCKHSAKTWQNCCVLWTTGQFEVFWGFFGGWLTSHSPGNCGFPELPETRQKQMISRAVAFMLSSLCGWRVTTQLYHATLKSWRSLSAVALQISGEGKGKKRTPVIRPVSFCHTHTYWFNVCLPPLLTIVPCDLQWNLNPELANIFNMQVFPRSCVLTWCYMGWENVWLSYISWF